MNSGLRITFDPQKDRANLAKHGVALSDFPGFDNDSIVIPDNRRNYGEERWRAFGRIGGVGYMIVFTVRGHEIRLISYRRAHEKEMRYHGTRT